MTATLDIGPTATRRPVTPDDAGFLAALYAAGRAAELAPVGWDDDAVAAFCAQQHALRERWYAAAHPGAVDEVLVVDGEPVGRLIVAREGDATVIVDLAVLPAHQGHGLGTATLRDVLAAAPGSVRLTVRRDNPAARLYARLGFVVVDDSGLDLQLEATR